MTYRKHLEILRKVTKKQNQKSKTDTEQKKISKVSKSYFWSPEADFAVSLRNADTLVVQTLIFPTS